VEVVGAEVGDVVAGEDELFVEDGAARELGQVGELLAGAVYVDLAVGFDAALAALLVEGGLDWAGGLAEEAGG